MWARRGGPPELTYCALKLQLRAVASLCQKKKKQKNCSFDVVAEGKKGAAKGIIFLPAMGQLH
jgi:hypothetical protein